MKKYMRAMKKSAIKILAMVMVLMMSISMLSGCGSSSKSGSDKKVLRVAMEAAYAPFNWTQTDDANGAYPIAGSDEFANGYDVMVAKTLCESMGYTLEIYKTDWDSLILGLNADKYDALICGMNILPERKDKVSFSTPYRTTTNCIIVRTDNKYANATSVADLKGCTSITQLNSNWEPLQKEIPEVNALPGVGTSPEIAAQVIAGKADIGIVDDPTAACMCKTNSELKYILFEQGKGFSSDGSETDNMGIAVKKSDSDLLDKINKAMKDTGLDQQDKQDEFMDKAISILPDDLN